MITKYALIIANTEYKDPKLAKLAAPANDAEALARVLQSPELAAFEEVKTLINETEPKTRRTIAEFFVNRHTDDLLLLYFSGHGIRDEHGRLYLATKDTDHTLLNATAIPADFVTQAMNNSHASQHVLILDCCNSGAFAAGTKAEKDANMGIGSAFEGTGCGRVVLTATDATQFAWEGDKITGKPCGSVFTQNLVKGLEGEADRDGDSVIDVDDLYAYAFEKTVKQNRKQTPQKWTYREQGKLILTTQVKPETIKPLPLDSNLVEDLKATRPDYVRKAVVQQLGIILNESNRGRALSAEQALKKVAETDDSHSIANLAGQLLSEYYAKTKPQPPQIKEVTRVPQPKPARKPQAQTQEAVVLTPVSVPPSRKEVEDKVEQKVITTSKPRQRGFFSKTPVKILVGIGGAVVVGLIIFGIASALKPKPSYPINYSFPTSTYVYIPADTSTSIPPTKTAPPPITASLTPITSLVDTFDSNATNWPTGAFDTESATVTRVIKNGGYDWNITTKNNYGARIRLPNGGNVSDFDLSIDGNILSGPSDADFGLTFRDNGSEYYLFWVTKTSFAVHTLHNSQWEEIIPSTNTSALLQNKINRIEVQAIGSHFKFLINNHLVGEADDSRLPSGRVGIFIGLFPGEQAEFMFDNFILLEIG
jgi:uncharacterized caspase-like protein